jgi:ABC-type transporter MlaC component
VQKFQKPGNKNLGKLYKNLGTKITKIQEQKFKKNLGTEVTKIWEQKFQKSGNKNYKILETKLQKSRN